MNQVTFRNLGGRHVPIQPWPQVFYVAKVLLRTPLVELRPLTMAGLLKGVGPNFLTMSYWRFVNALWKAGFLTTPDGARLSVRGHWRWTPWKIRAERMRKKNEHT